MEKYKDREWLYEQYITNKRSGCDIAKECDCSSILYWLQKFNIPVRSASEAQKLACKKGRRGTPEEISSRSSKAGKKAWAGNKKRKENQSRKMQESWASGERDHVGEKISLAVQARYAANHKDIMPYLTYDWLHEQYIVNEKSSNQIAEELGRGIDILYWLRKFNISIRSTSEAGKLVAARPGEKERNSARVAKAHADGKYGEEWSKKISKSTTARWDEDGDLRSEEVQQKMSAAGKINAAERISDPKWGKAHGKKIETAHARGIYEDHYDYLHDCVREQCADPEAKLGSEEHIQNIKDGLAEFWGSDEGKIRRAEFSILGKERWENGLYVGILIDEEGYRLESIKQRTKNPTGEDNPAWRGGTSFEPYDPEFNYERKADILERDNYTCQMCQSNGDMCIHHIDYNKKNSQPTNLIALCRSCHSRTNHRSRKFYQILLGHIAIQRELLYARR